MSCLIPISLGELYDKYSILLIKFDKIENNEKRNEVKKEIDFLTPFIEKFDLDSEIRLRLREVNEKLWEIEDAIREKEKKCEFDEVFIELARLVYKTNDKRAIIKTEINKQLNSEIVEIKSYI
jgi:hypothetical protein